MLQEAEESNYTVAESLPRLLSYSNVQNRKYLEFNGCRILNMPHFYCLNLWFMVSVRGEMN